MTATTEKSLGVLALLGDTTARHAVLDAIEVGNDCAMGWLEERAACGRIGGKPVKAEGWMVASFRHLTSRSLDPFPHHHNVVANTVTLPDGSHRALDARSLYRHAQAASALATAEMRRQLSARLGVRSANHLYLTAAANQLDDEALPRASGPSPDEAVEQRLERSTGELTAYELAHPRPAGKEGLPCMRLGRSLRVPRIAISQMLSVTQLRPDGVGHQAQRGDVGVGPLVA